MRCLGHHTGALRRGYPLTLASRALSAFPGHPTASPTLPAAGCAARAGRGCPPSRGRGSGEGWAGRGGGAGRRGGAGPDPGEAGNRGGAEGGARPHSAPGAAAWTLRAGERERSTLGLLGRACFSVVRLQHGASPADRGAFLRCAVPLLLAGLRGDAWGAASAGAWRAEGRASLGRGNRSLVKLLALPGAFKTR